MHEFKEQHIKNYIFPLPPIVRSTASQVISIIYQFRITFIVLYEYDYLQNNKNIHIYRNK